MKKKKAILIEMVNEGDKRVQTEQELAEKIEETNKAIEKQNKELEK